MKGPSENNAQKELEAARSDVMSTERELAQIKTALKALKTVTDSKSTEPPGGESSADSKDNHSDISSDENSLKVYATKITGLAEDIKPSIHIQLSSPIESQTLTSLYDPLDVTKEGSIATFRGVETDAATLELRLEDTNKSAEGGGNMVDNCASNIGRSTAYSVIPMCEIDFLGGGIKKKVTDLSVAILSDDGPSAKVLSKEGKEENEGEAGEKDENTTKSESIKNEDDKESREEKSESIENENDKEATEDKSGIDETKNKSEEGVNDDDDFQDAISRDDSTEKEGLEMSQTGSDEDAVVVPDASLVKEEVAKDSTSKKDDEVAPTPEQTTSITSAGEMTASAVVEDKSEEQKEPDTNIQSEQVIESEKNDSETKTTEGATTSTSTTSHTTEVLLPTCTVDIRVEFNPSSRDEEAVLCDLLNKAMKKKGQAIDRLRKAAELMNRSRQSSINGASTVVTKSDTAVKAGFLNKASKSSATKKEPIALVRWYNRYLGPQSLARIVFPVAKNYLLFFGGIVLMHFQGYQLALPPPV